MSSISVCKDCPDRRVGCHSICEKYIAEDKRNQKEREEARKQKEIYSAQLDRKIDGMMRMQKRRHH